MNSFKNLRNRMLKALRRKPQSVRGQQWRRALRAERLESRDLFATFTVASNVDGATFSLRDAITQANSLPGVDTIVFAPSTNGLGFPITLGEMTITDSLRIIGNGSDKTVIDARQLSRIFFVTSGSFELSNLELRNGKTTSISVFGAGGAIHSASTSPLTIGNSIISGNSTTGSDAYGGAIYKPVGSVTITNSLLVSNSTQGISGNGGAIFAGSGTVTIDSSEILGNTSANGDGGAISIGSGNLTIQRSSVDENSTSGTVTNGGAIFSGSGSVTIARSTLSGNSNRFGSGGAIYDLGGNLSIDQSTLTVNSTKSGGITKVEGGQGGAIFKNAGTLNISDSAFSNNFVDGTNSSGGAINVNSTITKISQSTFSSNAASGSNSRGGAILASLGALSITQSTVTLNRSNQAAGGGIHLNGSLELRLNNSIVAGNTDNGTAPDLFKSLGSSLIVQHSLIGRNNGTGLTATGSTTPSSSGNFVGGNSDQSKINPQLAPLTNNGGPTRTHALLVTSPAFNRGNNSLAVDITKAGTPALASDQRGAGNPRVAVSTVDMGAYEAFVANPIVVDSNLDEFDGDVRSGQSSLREAIFLANLIPGANSIAFATATNKAEFDLSLGEMRIVDSVTLFGNGASSTVIDAQQASRIFTVTTGNVTLEGLTLKNGKSDNLPGGAINFQSSGQLTVNNSAITGNSTIGVGGGADDPRGGGIFSAGPLSINRSIISGNSTDFGNGGAIYSKTKFNISESTISGNFTKLGLAKGGAIYSKGEGVIIASTLDGNYTVEGLSNGGAVFHKGKLMISQSTLSGNLTKGSFAPGGTIFNAGQLTISQSTIVGSNVDSSRRAVVSGLDSNSKVTIENSIIASNAGIDLVIESASALPAVVSIKNSLIGSTSVSNSGLVPTIGTTPDVNGNLIGGDTTATRLNPQLATLASNGGPTKTHALLATSPAVNRGSNQLAVDVTKIGTPALATDQRGNPIPRIANSIVDMGAYELLTATGTISVSTTVDELDNDTRDGDLSLREAVALANAIPGANVIRFATTTASEFDLSLGQINITETVTFNGNGASNTIIDAQQNSRIFAVSNGNATFNGMTLKNGKLNGNRDLGKGAAINFGSIGALVINNSELVGNSTTGDLSYGGAIYAGSGSVTINQSSLSDNSTSGDGATGGAIFTNTGSLRINRSTLSGNSTTGPNSSGGAIHSRYGAITLNQSTLSGNTSSLSSGGAVAAIYGPMLVSQSTLTQNNAANAGGIYAYQSALRVRNSIVAGNTANGSAQDIQLAGLGSLSVSSSLIGRNNGTSLAATGSSIPDSSGNLVGGNTAETTVRPELGPLASNGGPTKTHAPLATSPAVNRGNNAFAIDVGLAGTPPLTSDQRGNPVPRISDSIVDMGAVELYVRSTPIVVSTRSDEIDSDITTGDLSLREAIALANASQGADTITFDAAIGTQFNLSLGQMVISDTLTITGLGETQTIIDGLFRSRIFDVTNGSLTLNNLTLKSGRTTNIGGHGGAIRFGSSGALSINKSIVSQSSTLGNLASGGAIYSATGAVTINDSTLTGNATNGVKSLGGAVYTKFGAVNINQSTLSSNVTRGNESIGGAIGSNSGQVIITQSTLSGNSTLGLNSAGGAINTIFGALRLSQSTLSGNTALKSPGGGIASNNGSILVSQSTVTLNRSPENNGGGIYGSQGNLTINNSIVAGNTDIGTAPDVFRGGVATISVSSSLIGRNNGTGLTATGSSTPDSRGNLIGGNTSTTRVNPLLSPLAFNGGPTRTHALLGTSPAFNRGSNALAVNLSNSAPLTNDQRAAGFSRIQFGVVDMGAFEFGGTLVGTAATDSFVLTYSGTNNSGTVNVTISTEGRPATSLGTYPMSFPLTIDGLGQNDAVRIVGTSSTDTYVVNDLGLSINQARLVLNNVGNIILAGAAGDDIYRFDADTVLGSYAIDEANGGVDTIDFSTTTTVGLSLNLSNPAMQIVHPTNLRLNLQSATTIENVTGGAGPDTLTGNSLSNTLIGGAGNDNLNGGAGDDNMLGGLNDDRYIFDISTASESDQVNELANAGSDMLDFSALNTSLEISLGTIAVQSVHANRTLKLNSSAVFEHVIGGSADDVLIGNLLANDLQGGAGNNILLGMEGSDTLRGGSGRDVLIGGLGLDTLFGGSNEDILIAGRTTFDTNLVSLKSIRTEWLSANSYANRIASIRSGVGNASVSLKAKLNVLDDASEADSLNGEAGSDWFFKAVDDAISDLVAGEIIDAL